MARCLSEGRTFFSPLPYEEFSFPPAIAIPFYFISNFTPLEQPPPTPSVLFLL
jgi:hypothetical protein